MVLAMTDTPPSNVSILSAEVTLTGATLTPGNVSIFSGSTTIELTRLQTDIAYLATATNVPAGSYTGVTLTFANPMLTIENDTASAIGDYCVWVRFARSSRPRPQTCRHRFFTTLPVAPNSSAGLLIDVNLDNLLSATLGADFKCRDNRFPVHPRGRKGPLVEPKTLWGKSDRSAPRTIRLRCRM